MSSCSDTTGWSSLEPLGTPLTLRGDGITSKGGWSRNLKLRAMGYNPWKLLQRRSYILSFLGANGTILRGELLVLGRVQFETCWTYYVCFVPWRKYCLYSKNKHWNLVWYLKISKKCKLIYSGSRDTPEDQHGTWQDTSRKRKIIFQTIIFRFYVNLI